MDKKHHMFQQATIRQDQLTTRTIEARRAQVARGAAPLLRRLAPATPISASEGTYVRRQSPPQGTKIR